LFFKLDSNIANQQCLAPQRCRRNAMQPNVTQIEKIGSSSQALTASYPDPILIGGQHVNRTQT
jgi:hypothetical protein